MLKLQISQENYLSLKIFKFCETSMENTPQLVGRLVELPNEVNHYTNEFCVPKCKMGPCRAEKEEQSIKFC